MRTRALPPVGGAAATGLACGALALGPRTRGPLAAAVLIGLFAAAVLPGPSGSGARGAQEPGTPTAPERPTASAFDPSGRDVVLVRRECTSAIHRQEVTLFANGTVRLRQGPPGEEAMSLGELPPDEVEAIVDSLRGEDLSEGEGSGGPEGDWVEECRLELPVLATPGPAPRRPGSGPRTPTAEGGPRRAPGQTVFTYRRFDSLPLGLSRATATVDRLALRTSVRRGLPSDYRPRPGDVLRRADGVLFEVVRATARLGEDGPRGWELQGVVQPLAVYLAEDDVPALFVELVSRPGSGR